MSSRDGGVIKQASWRKVHRWLQRLLKIHHFLILRRWTVWH